MTDDGAPFESTFSWTGESFEYRIYPPDGRNPLIFLHDGLGSIGTWKDLPQDVAAATERPGIVYSRPGHGWSGPLRKPRTPQFMHHEAMSTLFYFIRELEVSDLVLIGHSDGASISLIFTGEHHWASGLVLIAPHVFVEPETIAGIEEVVGRFETTDLPQRMAKYHQTQRRRSVRGARSGSTPVFGAGTSKTPCPTSIAPSCSSKRWTTNTGLWHSWMRSSEVSAARSRGSYSLTVVTFHITPTPSRSRTQLSGL